MKLCKKAKAACILALVLSLVMISSTVFAATGATTWSQNSSKSITWGESHLVPTSNPNTGSVVFSGVASSDKSSTFTVKLYCKSGWLYSQLGTTYTVTSDSNYRFDPTTNKYVNGQPFRLVWPATVEADYKVVLTYSSGEKQTVHLNDLNLRAK